MFNPTRPVVGWLLSAFWKLRKEFPMSLDATILSVERDGADLVLTLGPRIDDADKLSTAGQPRMRIRNATWTPEPGMDLWGGGSSVQIVTKRGERDPVTNNAIGPWYRREGYTTLHEVKL